MRIRIRIRNTAFSGHWSQTLFISSGRNSRLGRNTGCVVACRELKSFEALQLTNFYLVRFGERVSSDIWRLGRECEENPPTLRNCMIIVLPISSVAVGIFILIMGRAPFTVLHRDHRS